MTERSFHTGRISRRLAPLALAVLMAGCSMMPRYEQPAAPVPGTWALYGLQEQEQEQEQQQEGGLPPLVPWSEFVNEPQLRELVALSLVNNRDLRTATQAMEKARAQYGLAAAGPWPSFNAGVTGERERLGDNVPIRSGYHAGLMLSSWEIDLFGRLSSLSEAARAQFYGTAYGREMVQTSLIASVAGAWLSLQTSIALVELTEMTLETREESQQLMQLRFDSGVASALDLRQTETLTATARVTLAEQVRARAQAVNALTLLVGQEIDPRLLEPRELPLNVFADVPAGLPSDLLVRRPDIQQAEWALRAANANIGAARAAFFPNISLTASVGSASSSLTDLFSSGTFAWTLAPSAMLPIFNAGRNRARLAVAEVDRDMAVTGYEKSIQTAFREVSDALAGRATLDGQLQAQQDLVLAEQQRFELSDLLYRSGVASFLDALDAQRALFTAQQALLQTRSALLANRIELYRVLGGGWQLPGQQPAEVAQANVQ